MYFQDKIYINNFQTIKKECFDNLRSSNILITGATGLVGSCIVDFLMYLNEYFKYDVNIYAVTRFSSKAFERFSSYANYCNLHIVECDLSKEIPNIDVNIDYILHAASNTHPELYAKNPVETMCINFIGTLNILKFMQQNYRKSKMIFLSTLEVYGEMQKNKIYFCESDIGKVDFNLSRSCYPESKRACETLCQSFIKEYELNITIARLGYIYGPTVDLSSSKADVQFLKCALEQKNIIMKSKGIQARSYCYVVDVVSALMFLMINGKNGEAYNIANKESNITLKDYAVALADRADVKIEFCEPSDIEKEGYSTVQNSTLNSDKIEQLGWRPQFSLREGVGFTLAIKKNIKGN